MTTTVTTGRPPLVERALEVARQGHAVFPLRTDKRPAPTAPHGFKSASRDEATIRRMFADPAAALIGVPSDNMLVLDVDPSGKKWMLERYGKELPRTRFQFTCRGQHLFYAKPKERVGCSAGKIAPGIDVRSSGGYVVFWYAQGYPCHNADMLAEAPAWLVEAARGSSAAAANDPLASLRPRCNLTPAQSLALARHLDMDSYDEWLMLGQALQHEYGDEGLPIWDGASQLSDKYPGADEVARKWASFGRNAGPPITMRAVINAAKRNGAPPTLWGGQLVAANFGPVVAEGQQPAAVDFQPAHVFVKRPPIAWHVKGILPKLESGFVFGQSGDGKTFFITDLLLHVADGRKWRGHRVKRGRVAVVCAEGAGGYAQRLQAAAQHLGIDLEAVCFEILPAAPQLASKAAVDDLIARIQARGSFDLLLIDTLAQVAVGLDENSAEMQCVLSACKAIHAATGATVILVHHAGKDASKGARGWSGMKAALDFEVEVTRDPADDTRVARISKQKDGEDNARYGFRLERIQLEGIVDEDGEPIWSCYVEPIDVLPKAAGRKLPRLGPNELVVEKAALAVCGLAGQATVDAVVAEAARLMAAPEAGERDQRRATARRALTSYAAKSGAELRDGVITMLHMLRGAT
jgi:hypothetical protein